MRGNFCDCWSLSFMFVNIYPYMNTFSFSKYMYTSRLENKAVIEKYDITLLPFLYCTFLLFASVDLELTINLTIFFSYTLWYVAYRKKWLHNSVWALRSYGPLKYVTISKNVIFCIFNTKTTMYQVIYINKHLQA